MARSDCGSQKTSTSVLPRKTGTVENRAEEQLEYTAGTAGTELGSQAHHFFFLLIHKSDGAYPFRHFTSDEGTCNPGFERGRSECARMRERVQTCVAAVVVCKTYIWYDGSATKNTCFTCRGTSVQHSAPTLCLTSTNTRPLWAHHTIHTQYTYIHTERTLRHTNGLGTHGF